MRIKVKDIAQVLELSPATVSMVLNDRPGISQKTRDKVFNYIQDMECMDPHQAQDNKKNILFIIYQKNGIDASGAPYFSQIFSEIIGVIEKQIRIRNYNFLCEYLSQENFPQEIEQMDVKECSGILVLGTEMTKGQMHELVKYGCPVVIVDNFCEDIDADFVTVNNEQGVFQALNYLKGLGHKQIGYLHVCQNAHNFTERYFAYLKYMKILGLEEKPEYIYNINTENIYEELKGLIYPDNVPAAFFADNDIVAASAIRLLREYGYVVPRDISVVGFDNMAFSEMLDPPLTTIQISKQKMGKTAAGALLQNLRHSPEGNIRIEVATKLIIRSSAAENSQSSHSDKHKETSVDNQHDDTLHTV